MKTYIRTALLFFVFCLLAELPNTPIHKSAMAQEGHRSFLAAGIGVEQLTYKEQIPDIELSSSDTDLTNWVLFLEGRRAMEKFFIGARGYIPLFLDESQEYWTKEDDFEQTNSLEYQWLRLDAHVGYFLHRLLNPYVGISWGYTEQKRSNFENVNTPGIFDATAVEEVSAFFALLGIQGDIPLSSRWTVTYFAEYQLPLYSNTTNSSAPGWEATNIDGYAYALTGSLRYAFNNGLSAALQVRGGKQHWDGSDWIATGTARAKWPENDTDFISSFISIYKHF